MDLKNEKEDYQWTTEDGNAISVIDMTKEDLEIALCQSIDLVEKLASLSLDAVREVKYYNFIQSS